MTQPTRSQIDAMRALPAAIKAANNAAKPLNGIAANWFHDEGAIAQCGCGRYTTDRRALVFFSFTCACGESHGWSGSFAKPGPDAIWHGTPPSTPSPLVGADGGTTQGTP